MCGPAVPSCGRCGSGSGGLGGAGLDAEVAQVCWPVDESWPPFCGAIRIRLVSGSAMVGRAGESGASGLAKQQGSAAVTREHKLALIVGFSLILLVGVLISDHLSSARQAKVGELGPGDPRIAEAPLIITEPLRGLEPPAPWPGASYAHAPEAVPQLPSPIVFQGGTAEPAAAPVEPPPVVIAQGRAEQSHGGDAALVETLNRHGFQLDAERGLIMPAAAEPRQGQVMTVASTPGAAPGFEWYTVQSGETLYQIAAKRLGNGNLWRELARQNSDRVDVNGNVRAGVKIRVPLREQAARSASSTPARQAGAPSASPPRQAHPQAQPTRPSPAPAHTTYTVQRGDTLGTISQRVLGTSRRWREIARLNGIEDEDHLVVGRVLKIPRRD
jgi:nucleoid-associated protein YgaU